MLDEEIASLLEDAGYRFAPESARYQVVAGAAADETEHSSEFVADELEQLTEMQLELLRK